MEYINLFDKDIPVKNELCSTNKDKFLVVRPKLRLYIKLTDNCNANCLFCFNKTSSDYGKIDLKKLKYVINYLYSLDRLQGISITGGEPLTDKKVLFQILDIIYNIDRNIEVQISTNGYDILKLLDYPDINILESIHISRHHYDEEVNKRIFNSNNVPTSKEIYLFQDKLEDKKIVNMNTVVMKNYIGNLEEIKKMLDYVGELGVYKNGFISLMNCNEFTNKEFINFNDIFSNLDGDFFQGHHFYARDYCECVDGIYLTKYKKLVEYYARMIKNNIPNYSTNLVYTSNNQVTLGFSNKVLYK